MHYKIKQVKWEYNNEFKLYDGLIENNNEFKLSIEINHDGKFLAVVCSYDYFVLDAHVFDTLEEAKEYIQNYIKEYASSFLEEV